MQQSRCPERGGAVRAAKNVSCSRKIKNLVSMYILQCYPWGTTSVPATFYSRGELSRLLPESTAGEFCEGKKTVLLPAPGSHEEIWIKGGVWNWDHLCWDLNSRCFRMVGDGHQPYSRVIVSPNVRSLDPGTLEHGIKPVIFWSSLNNCNDSM